MSNRGVFVGINHYLQESGLHPLQHAEADAKRLAEIFNNRFGFTTDLLLGEDATRDSIEDALDDAGSGELFVFFFAGHGGDVKGNYHLYPAGANAYGSRSISFDTLARTWQHGFGYKKVLVLLDACRNEFGGADPSRAK